MSQASQVLVMHMTYNAHPEENFVLPVDLMGFQFPHTSLHVKDLEKPIIQTLLHNQILLKKHQQGGIASQDLTSFRKRLEEQERALQFVQEVVKQGQDRPVPAFPQYLNYQSDHHQCVIMVMAKTKLDTAVEQIIQNRS